MTDDVLDGILFCPVENLIPEFPRLPVTQNDAVRRAEIDKVFARTAQEIGGAHGG